MVVIEQKGVIFYQTLVIFLPPLFPPKKRGEERENE